MDVILREDVDKVGRAGDVVSVKDGYARNYLLPHNLAYVATAGAKRRIEAETQRRDRRLADDLASAKKVGRALEKVTVSFAAKTGDGDRLFGSITSADIAEKLAEMGYTVDKRDVELDEPIKLIGEHRVPVRLHPDVRPEVTVSVTKE